MKRLLLTAALCSGIMLTYAQTLPEGTYMTDSTARDSLIFTHEQVFRYQGENGEGTFFGQGTYALTNDSLFLTYAKDVPGKIDLKPLSKKEAKKTGRQVPVTIYRAASPDEPAAIYGKYIMLELLDKDKKVLRLTELKGDGQYLISDSLLPETAFLRLAGDADQLAPGTNDYLFDLKQPMDKPVHIHLYTYPRLYQKIVSNTVTNMGKIAIISDRQFVLSNEHGEQTYTKK